MLFKKITPELRGEEGKDWRNTRGKRCSQRGGMREKDTRARAEKRKDGNRQKEEERAENPKEGSDKGKEGKEG